ncbi:hypothetical protein KEX41_28670 (plasmid) [Burkholderia thailandensis]|uniref:hypothetical protein n=1 Tax=Burkholderia thailandensis TaxID=57975 RepID=UPI00192DB60A|nr:hypothetical protein [Burkholderia thailandensis]MBS2132161.1 hypothetical protein [Burkholderia thailandensis]QRA15264.1 hypothetical protein JMY07_29095 [Burkholderia thailandensis]
MRIAIGALGFALMVAAIADAFQTVVVARHALRLPALARSFYRLTWLCFAAGARRIGSHWRRDRYLGLYGPLSLLLMLILWVVSLIIAFAMLHWAFDPRLDGVARGFTVDVYSSATTFFTLGAGPSENAAAEYLTVIEAGMGYSFLGLVIGYLPVLYQSFSERELRILMLDARAGSPPSAAQFILRRGGNPAKLEQRLMEWEEWALDLLRDHLSYPMLAFYRSQHVNQSWLAALTMVVDVSALAMLGAEDDLKRQAGFTFAAGRHALVHTAAIFNAAPPADRSERLGQDDFSRLCAAISANPTPLRVERIDAAELARLRSLYEPSAKALAAFLLMDLPPWMPPGAPPEENWRVTSWSR